LRLSNPAFSGLWRLDPVALAGEPHFAEIVEGMRGFFAETDWPNARANLLSLFGERVARAGQLDRNEGSIVDYASVPLPDGAVLTSWLDVSDSARLASARRERDDALAIAQRIRSEFIVDVNSEVRTPLNALLGLTDLLTDGQSGPLNERQSEYVRGIAEAGRRLLFAVDDIHDIAAFATGQARLTTGRVEVQPMLSAVVHRAKGRIRDKRVALALDCPAEVGAIVADERRLRQAIHNLLASAVTFVPAGGRVAVAARRYDGEVEFVIAASGEGMTPQDREEMFGGLRDPNGAPHDGADAGLELARQIVALHGGRLGVDDTPTGTSRIILHLPAGEA
jgi:signal transduction histidine kinase